MANPVAKSLRSPHLRQKKIKPRKGRGAYTRKGNKHEDQQLYPLGTYPP